MKWLSGYSENNRTIIVVTVIVLSAALLAMAMWLRYDLSWLPDFLGGLVGSQ